jgi:hypothetical protein
MCCLPYRNIESIKGTIRLENPDDLNNELTTEEINIVIKDLEGVVKKVDMYVKSGNHFAFDINEWMNARNCIIEKLKKQIGE